MNKSKKLYVKALEKYSDGYINKAIELSEESISLDIKNAAAINLKGLLYYLKGDLNTCQRLWKMNWQVNRDEVSQKYLSDSKNDAEREVFYAEALSLIKELKINDALEILEQCSESDYNYINVNNYISVCYMNKGEYDKALSHIEKVLKVDRDNDIAKENKKALKKIGVIKFKMDKKKIAYIVGGLAITIVIALVTINFTKRSDINKLFTSIKNKIILKSSIMKENTNKIAVKEGNNVKNATVKNNTTTTKEEAVVFPADKIKSDIESKNFDSVYDEYMKWKDKNLAINDKLIISKACELLIQEGINYFYNKGSESINRKDYSQAKEYLLKAYNLGNQGYLYSHIVYMLGSSYELHGDAESALKYYIQYDESFSNGDYEEAILYNIAMIYKDIDKDKARIYGRKLMDKYPKSIYNNSIIKELVSR